MLRRALRILFSVLGIALLVWLPISFARVAYVTFPFGRAHIGIVSDGGDVLIWHRTPWSIPASAGFGDRRVELNVWQDTSGGAVGSFRVGDSAIWPDAGTVRMVTSYTFVRLPLSVLAALCLAWPMTSFILARRRRKGRGFAVEPLVEGMKDEG